MPTDVLPDLAELPYAAETRRLQERVDGTLRRTGRRLSLTPDDKLSPGVRRVLALFDAHNGPRLAQECRTLADGGSTTTGNATLPASMQRTILRESLSDNKIFDLVRMSIDPTATSTTEVPYEVRRPGKILNDGIVYEGHGIPFAGFDLRSDSAYILPLKLAFSVSNELAHFFGAAGFLGAPDAFGQAVDSNSRLLRELLAKRVANELQRSADAYGAVSVSGENIAAQLTGSASLIKSAHWPIVRSHQARNLQGAAINAPEHPLTLILNDASLAAWNGSGDQPDGTYWVVENYNLGLIRLVDATGEPVTPTATGTCTLSYSYATNCAKFDSKLPSGTLLEDHLNGALRAIGAQKAKLSGQRFAPPDAMLMSPGLNDLLTNARAFTASWARPGTTLALQGDLETIKALAAYSTNAPGIDLGDERALLLQSNTLTYVVAKPLQTSAVFEKVSADGNPSGEKMAYGEEYDAVHIPTPLRAQLSSVIVYDSDERAAAA